MHFSWLNPEYLIQTFSYLGLFGIMFAETGLLLGFFLPGDSLLLAAGLYAARGDLVLGSLVLACFLGAVVGNTLGYAIGRRFGPRVFSRPDSRLLRPEYVEQARAFFERYGAVAIILGRFVPVVRTLVPTMAGAGGMNFATFTLYNVLGGVLWTGGLPVAGYFLGRVIPPEVLDKYILVIVGAILVISVVPVALEVLRRRAHTRG